MSINSNPPDVLLRCFEALSAHNEKVTMMKKYRILIFVPLLVVIGCSGEDGSATNDKPSSEHVFKDKVQALEKAKELEIMLQNAADKQRQTIEEQTKDMR